MEERGGNEPDGGIDLILRKKDETTLVQCKHWETEQVGVKIVRELYGVVAAEGATKGVIVTTGYFTRDAEMFAHGKPLLLIRGNELSRLLEEGQKSLTSKSSKTSNRRPQGHLGGQTPNLHGEEPIRGDSPFLLCYNQSRGGIQWRYRSKYLKR